MVNYAACQFVKLVKYYSAQCLKNVFRLFSLTLPATIAINDV